MLTPDNIKLTKKKNLPTLDLKFCFSLYLVRKMRRVYSLEETQLVKCNGNNFLRIPQLLSTILFLPKNLNLS